LHRDVISRWTGTSFDGGGVGTNQPDTDVWKVYSANGTHPAPAAPHQVFIMTKNVALLSALSSAHKCSGAMGTITD
jgi:hypothetical protein